MSVEVGMKSHFADESMYWRKLCRAAAVEQDADKLVQIVRKLNSALLARQRKLRSVAGTRRNNVAHISSGIERAA